MLRKYGKSMAEVESEENGASKMTALKRRKSIKSTSSEIFQVKSYFHTGTIFN